ncbi:hypothetical protein ACFE04_025553 [Oxalis oulophora]
MDEKKLSAVRHLYFSFFLFHYSALMVIPAITDITMTAICPAQLECSLAIYLSGLQQAVIGVGTLLMIPLIGSLSDKYGRKSLLNLPMTLHADNVPEGRRASAFGVLSGIGSGSFVCGTLSSRFISTSATCQVAAFVGVVAAIYMRIFLPDSMLDENLSASVISRGKVLEDNFSDEESAKKISVHKRLPSLEDVMALLKSSPMLSQAAAVAFLSNLADLGFHTSVMYYLKARFNFKKDQFADIMVIGGVAGTVSQSNYAANSNARIVSHYWRAKATRDRCSFLGSHGLPGYARTQVPYVAVMFSVLFVYSQPCLRSIVSKQVGSCEQGKAQGLISGICSFASVVAPLIFSPLTALFLSERAPFKFPGFSIICVGFVAVRLIGE